MKTDEIIDQIAQQTGISQDQSRAAFMAGLEHIKTKLPDSVGSQLTGLLEGKEFDYNLVMKDKIVEFREEAQERLEKLRDEAKEKIDVLKEEAKTFIDKMF